MLDQCSRALHCCVIGVIWNRPLSLVKASENKQIYVTRLYEWGSVSRFDGNIMDHVRPSVVSYCISIYHYLSVIRGWPTIFTIWHHTHTHTHTHTLSLSLSLSLSFFLPLTRLNDSEPGCTKPNEGHSLTIPIKLPNLNTNQLKCLSATDFWRNFCLIHQPQSDDWPISLLTWRRPFRWLSNDDRLFKCQSKLRATKKIMIGILILNISRRLPITRLVIC